MARRIAASMALVAFAVCILVGLQAQNTFSGILSNAILALVVTFAVGLVIGTMAQKMLEENLADRARVNTAADSQAQTEARDR